MVVPCCSSCPRGLCKKLLTSHPAVAAMWVFEWKKRRKIRFFAEKPASRRAQSRASTTKRAVFARARTLRWWRVARPNSSRGKPGNGDGMMYFSLDAVGMDKTPSKRFVRHQPTLIPRRVSSALLERSSKHEDRMEGVHEHGRAPL